MRRAHVPVVSLLLLLGVPATAGAQSAKASAGAESAIAEFYKGNTVYMVVGSAAGGGFDLYARIVSKYMTIHLPGNPNFVAQNVPGANDFAAGTRITVSSPQDGTYVGAIHPSSLVAPILGERTPGLKPLTYAFLGSASANIEACYLRTDAEAKSFSDGWDKEIVLGASTQSSSSREYAALLKNALGMKIRIVGGYKGTADINLALERGEVQGTCGAGIASTIASQPKWFSDGLVKIMSYQGPRVLTGIKEIGDAKPAVEYTRTKEQREILTLYDLQEPIGRPFVTGTQVPAERIKALQTAFMAAMGDPGLVQELESKGLDVGPVAGPEVEAIVNRIVNAPPEIVAKTREALGYD